MFGRHKIETINANQAYEMMKTEDVTVVDVREENEYRSGHVPHALSIPLSTITKNNKNLPNQDEKLLVYCRSGVRSKQASKKFMSLGYKEVYDFGGILDWDYDIEK